MSKASGDRPVLRDVSFDVEAGEFFAVVGPSASGKTTLLRCIDGLLAPDAGHVAVAGQPVTGPPESVAMVFQDRALFPWKSVYDNVAYGLQMAGVPRTQIAQEVATHLQLFGLQGFDEALPHELSPGMQERCALARALVVRPSVLLLDEPFGALDPQARQILRFELLRLRESRPVTVLLATRSIEEAVLMADRIAVLRGRPGHVQEIVDVPLPQPRNRASLADPRFGQVREHIWRELMDDAWRAQYEPHA